MEKVRAKKHLGQHFLNDKSIAEKIVGSLSLKHKYKRVLEVGPGMGVLTQFLILDQDFVSHVVEVDRESIAYLKKNYGAKLEDRIIEGDFLRLRLETIFSENFAVIGNFPYNISSQIFFKILEYRDYIPEAVGMVQKEVAERLAAKHGNKTYGILSVLIQAFYNIEYLFTVHEHVFIPPPKVKSGVIRLTRNDRDKLPCDEKFFFMLVKQSFSTRRKTLRNCLKGLNLPAEMMQETLFDKRAEQLSVNDFIELATRIEKIRNT
ncbi:MAG TPA: 16S rRNA (adenine(1518)-N(6)/adenine(1519)-N(6))-dimethyltransferase RsmA [Cytophagaceae bacterium]|nr:16S rRNA (adenine(1518)-N(6)/adenine(1519)-N(6))-dimethyltransferase RsmA [Cytophagaceae bacterium]